MQANLRSVDVLVDNDSWILPFAEELVADLNSSGHPTRLVRRSDQLRPGWVNFMLGCTTLLPIEKLQLYRHNLVVHESALPQGKGFAPMAWQILEGRNRIPVTLFEATTGVDDGPIWLTDTIELQGHELLPEWRASQGRMTINLCKRFVKDYEHLHPRVQSGESSRYRRRRAADSEIDPYKSLADQFELLRVVDNERYPAFFSLNGRRYFLRIDESGEQS